LNQTAPLFFPKN